MKKTLPEPEAELLPAEELHLDVASLSEAIENRKAERRVYLLLKRKRVRAMLDQLIQSGICRNEEEAIERALKTLVTAVMPR